MTLVTRKAFEHWSWPSVFSGYKCFKRGDLKFNNLIVLVFHFCSIIQPKRLGFYWHLFVSFPDIPVSKLSKFSNPMTQDLPSSSVLCHQCLNWLIIFSIHCCFWLQNQIINAFRKHNTLIQSDKLAEKYHPHTIKTKKRSFHEKDH